MMFHDVEKEATLKPVEEYILQLGANVTEGARSNFRVMRFTRDFACKNKPRTSDEKGRRKERA